MMLFNDEINGILHVITNGNLKFRYCRIPCRPQ